MLIGEGVDGLLCAGFCGWAHWGWVLKGFVGERLLGIRELWILICLVLSVLWEVLWECLLNIYLGFRELELFLGLMV